MRIINVRCNQLGGGRESHPIVAPKKRSAIKLMGDEFNLSYKYNKKREVIKREMHLFIIGAQMLVSFRKTGNQESLIERHRGLIIGYFY